MLNFGEVSALQWCTGSFQGSDFRVTLTHPPTPFLVRNPEKGAFARGALRKFVANCTRRVRKIVADLSRIRKFGQFYANTPFPMLWSWLPPNSPKTLENFKVSQKWLKSDFCGGRTSLLIWVSLRETPESHFLVTFEWLWSSPGFRGSWGAARIPFQCPLLEISLSCVVPAKRDLEKSDEPSTHVAGHVHAIDLPCPHHREETHCSGGFRAWIEGLSGKGRSL